MGCGVPAAGFLVAGFKLGESRLPRSLRLRLMKTHIADFASAAPGPASYRRDLSVARFLALGGDGR
jgi:hypothetical protein